MPRRQLARTLTVVGLICASVALIGLVPALLDAPSRAGTRLPSHVRLTVRPDEDLAPPSASRGSAAGAATAATTGSGRCGRPSQGVKGTVGGSASTRVTAPTVCVCARAQGRVRGRQGPCWRLSWRQWRTCSRSSRGRGSPASTRHPSAVRSPSTHTHTRTRTRTHTHTHTRTHALNVPTRPVTASF
jgi:hypothetical protein